MYQWCGFKSRRGKNKYLTALKSNSNTVWFNFQTYIYNVRILNILNISTLYLIVHQRNFNDMIFILLKEERSRFRRDRMVVGFTTTYAILSCEFESAHGEMYSDTTVCDTVC